MKNMKSQVSKEDCGVNMGDIRTEREYIGHAQHGENTPVISFYALQTISPGNLLKNDFVAEVEPFFCGVSTNSTTPYGWRIKQWQHQVCSLHIQLTFLPKQNPNQTIALR